jgi:peptide/nickel transport system ATP-binding protein
MSIEIRHATAPLLQVERLQTHFRLRGRYGWGSQVLRAVNDVSFAIERGRTLGLVGESGCGKSTLGRTILGLYKPAQGSISLGGEDLGRLSGVRLRRKRLAIQAVFQDPYSSLDPRMSVTDIVAEPLRINRLPVGDKVARALADVGLPPSAAAKRPAQFSGGQRQRIAIARALVLDPELIILDEAVSALDVSIQAQIINLLKRLQRERGVAYLFISHNLAVVRHSAHEVAVMYLGRIVETGARAQVFDRPSHPYTQALLSAVPIPDPAVERPDPVILQGDMPNPIDPPSGCVFRTRCPIAQPLCAENAPELVERGESGHRIACHFAAATPVTTVSHTTPIAAGVQA